MELELLTIRVDVVSLEFAAAPDVEKVAPAIIVMAPPFVELELVSITPAPAAVIILVAATMASAEPEKLRPPAIVTEPILL